MVYWRGGYPRGGFKRPYGIGSYRKGNRPFRRFGGGGYNSINRGSVRAVGYVKRKPIINRGRPEIKSFDQQVAAPGSVYSITNIVGSIPTAAFAGITVLNPIAVGAAFYQRIGARVNNLSCDIRFNATYAPTLPADPPALSLRWLVVYDTQCNKAYPLMSDLFAVNDAGTPNFNSSCNMANRSRFVVMRDKIVTLDNGRGLTQSINKFVRLRGVPTMYYSSGADQSFITTGALWFILFSSIQSTTLSGTLGISNISTRIRYSDA